MHEKIPVKWRRFSHSLCKGIFFWFAYSNVCKNRLFWSEEYRI